MISESSRLFPDPSTLPFLNPTHVYSEYRGSMFPQNVENHLQNNTVSKSIKSTKMAVFRVVVPCSLVEVYRRFRGDDRPDFEGSKDL
jgi:hypothetical protein